MKAKVKAQKAKSKNGLGRDSWLLSAHAHTGGTAGEEAAVGVVGEGDLAGNGQLVVSGGCIDRFVVGNGFQLEVLAGSPQGTLLPHHGGDAVGFLSFRPLLFPGLLAVLQTEQARVQLLSSMFLQWVTRYRSYTGWVKGRSTTIWERPRVPANGACPRATR